MLTPIQVGPDLQAYMESLLPERAGVLRRLEEEAESDGVPIVGPHVGQLITILLRMAGAKDVVELGAATGYSGLWLLHGSTGRMVTFEKDPKRAAQARANFEAAGFGSRVEVRVEDAVEGLERLPGPLGAVFNDLLNHLPDEAAIEEVFELSVARLAPGGLLLADNALRRGEVVEPAGQAARNVAEYNRLVAAHPRLRSIVIPIRDGFSVAVLD